jgi:NADH dehydrogenase
MSDEKRAAVDLPDIRSNGHQNGQSQAGLENKKQSPVSPGRLGGKRRPRVVIVGAGFGGINCAKALGNTDVEVLLVDRNNYHGFWPLLYQVATAGLEPQSIAYPVRGILRRYDNIDFQMTEVTGLDLANRRIKTTGTKELEYDYLVLAAGSANAYFGNNKLAQETLGLKNLEDAINLRNRVLEAFEQAVQEPDPEQRIKHMTFVVVGAGPTGVELVGSFSELIRYVLRKDYPSLDTTKARVILLEAIPKILSTFPEELQLKARKTLEKMGVEVSLGNPVASVENGVVTLKDGTQIEAGTVVWAAGVRAAPIGEKLEVKLARQQRVPVELTLQLPDHPEIFVIGDMAYLEGFKKTQPYPMVAPVAIQMGKQAAHNILALLHDQPLKPFTYTDKGNMATIGRRNAVFEAFGIKMTGFIAWLAWLFVHLITLMGFRNRLVVFLNWAYSYFTYDRGARLITGEGSRSDT